MTRHWQVEGGLTCLTFPCGGLTYSASVLVSVHPKGPSLLQTAALMSTAQEATVQLLSQSAGGGGVAESKKPESEDEGYDGEIEKEAAKLAAKRLEALDGERIPSSKALV